MVLKDWDKIETWEEERHYRILDSVPNGFVKKELIGSEMVAPEGYNWYWNKKSRFAKDPKDRFEKILVKN